MMSGRVLELAHQLGDQHAITCLIGTLGRFPLGLILPEPLVSLGIPGCSHTLGTVLYDGELLRQLILGYL